MFTFDTSILPVLPEGFFWGVRPEMGNYDDGVHTAGTCVTVGIRKSFRVFFVKGSAWVPGVKVCLADPRIPGDIEDAAKDVHRSFVENILTSHVDEVSS